MRNPLIRQGEGAAGFQRIHTELNNQRARIDRSIHEHIDTNTTTRATAAGDTRKLRGIPAIGRGVQGAIHGTRP